MAGNGPESAWFGGRARWFALPRREDPRGALLPLDFDRLPFVPRRVFVVHDVPPGTTRGGHAHRSSRMLLVRLAGRIDVELRAGGERTGVVLDRSDAGLLLEPGVWAAHTYVTPGATVLVLADEPFDPAGYSTTPDG